MKWKEKRKKSSFSYNTFYFDCIANNGVWMVSNFWHKNLNFNNKIGRQCFDTLCQQSNADRVYESEQNIRSYSTLIHSFPVCSSSTTTASMNFPMATVTARLYFFCVGLQRSVMRPWTPWNNRLRVWTAWDNLESLSFSYLSALTSRNSFSISSIFNFRLSYFCLYA